MEEIITEVAVIKALQQTHHEQLAEIRADLKCIKSAQAETNNRLSAVNWCPKPGTCIQLLATTENHAAILRSLEDSRLQATTSGRVLMWMVCGTGLLSAIIGAVIAKLI